MMTAATTTATTTIFRKGHNLQYRSGVWVGAGDARCGAIAAMLNECAGLAFGRKHSVAFGKSRFWGNRRVGLRKRRGVGMSGTDDRRLIGIQSRSTTKN